MVCVRPTSSPSASVLSAPVVEAAIVELFVDHVSLLLVVKLLPAMSLRQRLNLPRCDFEPARMTMYVLRHVWKPLDS